jgi:pilus assembly protein Flp/PilA
MSKINNWVVRKVVAAKAKEEGQGLAEYGLILALIAVLCVAALTGLQGQIEATLDAVGAAM